VEPEQHKGSAKRDYTTVAEAIGGAVSKIDAENSVFRSGLAESFGFFFDSFLLPLLFKGLLGFLFGRRF